MTSSLEKGLTKTRNFTVQKDQTIGFMGEDARVYATPALIADIEHTCRDLIKEHVADEDDSVGFEVSVKHLAPTLMGMDVSVIVTITSTEGPKVVFNVRATDAAGPICDGYHTRFVVNTEKTKQRLKAKADKVASLSKA